jgi:hypothetical protein
MSKSKPYGVEWLGYWIGKHLERNGHSLTTELSWKLPARIGENQEEPRSG